MSDPAPTTAQAATNEVPGAAVPAAVGAAPGAPAPNDAAPTPAQVVAITAIPDPVQKVNQVIVYSGIGDVKGWINHYREMALQRTDVGSDLERYLSGRALLWFKKTAKKDRKEANSFISLQEFFGHGPVFDFDLSVEERDFRHVVQGDATVFDYIWRYRDAARTLGLDLDDEYNRHWFLYGVSRPILLRMNLGHALSLRKFEELCVLVLREETPSPVRADLQHIRATLMRIEADFNNTFNKVVRRTPR